MVRLGWLKRGDTVDLTFPLPERTIYRVLGEVPYKLVLRGSNVVSIDPEGTAYPLYQNRPTGKLVRKARFLPSTSGIIW